MTESRSDRALKHLGLAGCLYAAQNHVGRYLERGPTDAQALAAGYANELLAELIRYHEAAAEAVGRDDVPAPVVSLEEHVGRVKS